MEISEALSLLKAHMRLHPNAAAVIVPRAILDVLVPYIEGKKSEISVEEVEKFDE